MPMKENTHTTSIQAELNYRNFKEEKDNPFYATYLNTAKQNVFIVLRDISEKLGLNFTDNDDKMLKVELWKKLKSNEKPELTQKIIERLEQQFSFLNILAKNNAFDRTQTGGTEAEHEDYHDVLKSWIGQLLNYRNHYTHAVHDKADMDPAIVDGMRILYDADWQELKKRNSLKAEETNHLIRLGKHGERQEFHYAFTDAKGLTEKGFLFFVCLWLEKRDAQELLKKHKGFKRSELKSQKATLERYTWFRTRIPKPKLTSDNSQQGLFMDMVNELKRCPKELFLLLSKEDQAKFIPKDFDEDSYDPDEYNTIPELKRKTNRFYYFALRYLDTTFQNLKFHIDLGNYCYRTYDQEIEEIPRKRRWIKRMMAFGNLTDFDETPRPQEWIEKLFKVADGEKPDTYITDTTPHYHFDACSDVKNIGLKWIDHFDNAHVWPKTSTIDESGAEPKPRNKAPDFWLSLYELPAIAFYQILYQNGIASLSAEQVIAVHKGKIEKFLSQIEEGILTDSFNQQSLEAELKKRGLQRNHLPRHVMNFLLSKQDKSFEEKSLFRLEKLKEENDRMLGKVIRQKSHYRRRPGSKDYIAMKSGNMADFLARDMIQLQKPLEQEKGKANPTEFQILQAKLAFFGKNKETLADTLRLCNLIDSGNPHPFLLKTNIENCSGILEFYIQYLELRGEYLNQCLQKKNYTRYHYLKLNNEQKDIKALMKKQKEAVMNLPRGLFHKPIFDALKNSEKTKKLAEELEKKDRVNVSFIIREYFRKIGDDDYQEFYSYKRSYELLNKLYDERRDRDRSPVRPVYFTEQELKAKEKEIKQKLEKRIQQHIQKNKFQTPEDKARVQANYRKQYKQFLENEKQIRLFKTCDMVLFLMVDQLYRKGNFLFDGDKGKQHAHELEICQKYKLREIKPDSEKSILSEQVGAQLRVYYPEKEKDHFKIIVREHMKIKNYGDFRAFLKDRRVTGMLPYIEAQKVQYEAVKRELETFGGSRLSVLEKVIEFEKAAIKKYSLHPNNEGYIRHEDILKKVPGITSEKLEQMKQLRNVFCHSQYPPYALFAGQINRSGFNQLKNYRAEKPEIGENSIVLQLKKMALDYYMEALEIVKSG
jgi:hypothetical protein